MKSFEILLALLNKKYTDVKSKLEKIELINSVPLEKGKGKDSYLVSKENGIVLIFNYKMILENIYLYSEGYDGFAEFKTLPFDLKFSMNKTEVEKKFENIQKNEGGNVSTPILGWKNLWQAYEFNKYILQIHYNKQCSSIEYIIIGRRKNNGGLQFVGIIESSELVSQKGGVTILRNWRDKGLISNSEYTKLIKNQ